MGCLELIKPWAKNVKLLFERNFCHNPHVGIKNGINIFIGFPVAWTMGGLAVLFTLIAMLSDSYLDTFFGVDWKFSSMVVYRLYGVMANWVLVALPMFIFMGIMMDKSGIAEAI